MLSKNKGTVYDDLELYSWQGSGSAGLPWVRIRRLVWGSPEWVQVCNVRSRLCQRVYRGWSLSPPRFNWTDAKWNDWNSWRRILGDRRPWFRPNLTVELGYGSGFDGRFFFEAFRFAPIGMSDRACAERIGNLMALMFTKLPRPGESSDLIDVRDPLSEENQTLWLGVVLQASRMVLG